MHPRMFFYISIIFNFGCKSQGNSDDGIVISLGGKEIPNHGLVTTQDIGVDPTGTNLTVGLSCSTTNDMCCSDLDEETYDTIGGAARSGNGSWLYPNKRIFKYVSRQYDKPNNIYGIKRHGNAVYMFRNHLNRIELSHEDGIWRCIIPDARGTEQTKFIGVYSNETSNGRLSVGTPATIQFSILSKDPWPVIFKLTFRTTGGPATFVTWTRNGVNISLSGDNHYITSQTILVNYKGLHTDGDYSNKLTVIGRIPGVYAVSVTNDRMRVPVKSGKVSVIDFPHSSTNVVRSTDLSNIYLSWKLVDSFPKSLTGLCEIRYTVCPMVPGGCETTSVTVDLTDTRYSIPNVILWATYNFTIMSQLISVNQSMYILPGSISSHTITIDGILAPEIYSVTELANITTVQVTWKQPEGGLAVDEYVVSYTRLNGRDGQCSSFQDRNNVTLNSEGEAVTYTTNLHLEANSVYVVNVTGGIIGVLHNTSIAFQFETNSTAPSKGPQNLTIINITSTSMTISWDSVECIHRNGLIIQYLLIMDTCDNYNHETFVIVDSDGPDNGGSYTATALQPSFGYLFKVAAINRNGVGSFTVVTTMDGTCGKRSNNATTAGMATVIAILVLIIAVVSVTFISIGVYRTSCRVRPKGGIRNKREMKICLTDSNAEELEYDEPKFPSSVYSLQLEACPAYKTSET